MARREDEAPVRNQQVRQRGRERRDLGDVHQGHVADDGVEMPVAERAQRGLVRRVAAPEIHLAPERGAAAARVLQQRLGDVDRHHTRAELGEPKREDPVAAGEIEHAAPGDIAEQPLHGRADDEPVEVVAAIAHARVPERGILLPRLRLAHAAILGDCAVSIRAQSARRRHAASWKTSASVMRSPLRITETPCRTGAADQPRFDSTGRSRVVNTRPCPWGISVAVPRDCARGRCS
jgi:hypothetical protein